MFFLDVDTPSLSVREDAVFVCLEDFNIRGAFGPVLTMAGVDCLLHLGPSTLGNGLLLVTNLSNGKPKVE